MKLRLFSINIITRKQDPTWLALYYRSYREWSHSGEKAKVILSGLSYVPLPINRLGKRPNDLCEMTSASSPWVTHHHDWWEAIWSARHISSPVCSVWYSFWNEVYIYMTDVATMTSLLECNDSMVACVPFRHLHDWDFSLIISVKFIIAAIQNNMPQHIMHRLTLPKCILYASVFSFNTEYTFFVSCANVYSCTAREKITSRRNIWHLCVWG